MEYAIIGIIIVVVLVTSMVISKKSKKNASDVVNEGVRHIEEKTEVQLVPSENEIARTCYSNGDIACCNHPR